MSKTTHFCLSVSPSLLLYFLHFTLLLCYGIEGIVFITSSIWFKHIYKIFFVRYSIFPSILFSVFYCFFFFFFIPASNYFLWLFCVFFFWFFLYLAFIQIIPINKLCVLLFFIVSCSPFFLN